MLFSPGNDYVGEMSYTLTLLDTFQTTSPEVYSTGVEIAELNAATAGKEYLYGGGTSIPDDGANGTLYCVDAQGNSLWTYNSPNNDYIMLIHVDDIDGDGDNEIAVGLRLNDHACVLLNNAGSQVWKFDLPVNNYCRFARIGKVRNDYTGKQVVCGGANGRLYLLDKDGNQIWLEFLTDPIYNTVQDCRIADIDDDGNNEIIVACGEAIRVHDSVGDQIAYHDIATAGGSTYGAAVGHIQHKDSLQMLGANVDNLALISPDGTIEWRWSPGVACWTVDAADLDGDGYDEVIVGWNAGVSIISRFGEEAARYSLPAASKIVRADASSGKIISSCDDGNAYLFGIS